MPVTEFTHQERITRQRAAERLADIAYALTAGDTIDLRAEGKRASVPVAGEVVLKRKSSSHGDRIEVELALSWTAQAETGSAGASSEGLERDS